MSSSERSEPVGSPVKVVKVCFAYVVKPFTGEVVKVCSGPKFAKLPLKNCFARGQFQGFLEIRLRVILNFFLWVRHIWMTFLCSTQQSLLKSGKTWPIYDNIVFQKM